MNLKEFFTMISGPSHNVHIRSTSINKALPTKEFWIDPTKFDNDSMEAEFTKLSETEERNIWFQVGATDNGVKTPVVANVMWADIDLYKYPGGETQALGLLRRLPKPTVIVRSGRGLHMYWKMNEPLPANTPMSPAQELSKMIQWYLGADAAHSPAKLLRVPHTYNFKPDEYEGGKLCEIIQHNDVSYDPSDFTMDDILFRVGHKLMVKIMLGPTELAVDRSEYDFHCAAELFNNGFTVDEVSHLMRTYPFSGKVGSEPQNAINYITRTLKSAAFRSALQPKKTKKEAAVWEGKTLSVILKEEKPPFIVNDFLPNAGVAMIAAPPKARKSWCVMQLAYSVATGQKWLGFTVPKPAKVLYVQAELPNWMVAERMEQMYGIQHLENVEFFHVPAANLLDDEDLQGLLDAVTSFGAELVIIDPVANFWQGDENNSSSVNSLFDQIAKIQLLNCAVVMVHHSRKTEFNERLSPQHQRGSNVFFARPAAVMTLSPIMVPGQVPHTFADFALRAAAPVEPLQLYVAENGQFTLTAPSFLTEPPVKTMLRQRLAERKVQSDVLSYEGKP